MKMKKNVLTLIVACLLVLAGTPRTSAESIDGDCVDKESDAAGTAGATASEKVIYLAFYEGVDRGIVEELIPMLKEQLFNLPVKLVDGEMPVPEEAYEKVRDKYYAGKMLEMLAGGVPDDSLAYIAVTDKNIYVGRRPEVRGLANPGLGVAVVSTFNMEFQASRFRYKLRMLKEILHEAGHLFGQEHCESDKHCLMGFSQGLTDLDAKHRAFCPFHQKRIGEYLSGEGVDLEKYRLREESVPAPGEEE